MRLLLLLPLLLLLSASDCVPGVAIGEAAECCGCLARTDAEGADDVDADVNCLPDDISQGLARSVEEQQCAADAGDAITGQGVVTTVAACRVDPHPCAEICAAAAEAGVEFDDVD